MLCSALRWSRGLFALLGDVNLVAHCDGRYYPGTGVVNYNYEVMENILRDIFAGSILELAQLGYTRQGVGDEGREIRAFSHIDRCFVNSDTVTAIDLRPSSDIVRPLVGPRRLSDHAHVSYRLLSPEGRHGGPAVPKWVADSLGHSDLVDNILT